MHQRGKSAKGKRNQQEHLALRCSIRHDVGWMYSLLGNTDCQTYSLQALEY